MMMSTSNSFANGANEWGTPRAFQNHPTQANEAWVGTWPAGKRRTRCPPPCSHRMENNERRNVHRAYQLPQARQGIILPLRAFVKVTSVMPSPIVASTLLAVWWLP